jgi:cytidylate kinase
MTSSPTSTMKPDAAQLGLPNVALCGKAGAGKTTAAQLLGQFGYETRSFAGPLKDMAATIWGDEARADRDKLQRLGCAVRDIDPDAWCDLLVRNLDDCGEAPIVVDDMRFENEWWALKGAGFTTIRVTAPRGTRINRLKANGKWRDEEQLEHVSETAIDYLGADYTVRNDFDEFEFYDQLSEVLKKEYRRR